MKKGFLVGLGLAVVLVAFFAGTKFYQVRRITTVDTGTYLVGFRDSSGVINDRVWNVGSLATYISSAAAGINNSSLRWTGSYTQRVAKYGMNFDSVGFFIVRDTMSHPVLHTTAGMVGVLHYMGLGSQPTIVARGGAGTSAAVNVDAIATDGSGVISVTAGASGISGDTICTVAFALPYAQLPYVTLADGDAHAAGLAIGKRVYCPAAEVTVNGFTLHGTLTPGTAYKWVYWVH